MRQFRHLNVPEHWEHYWSKYPQGYTILEALVSWVSQVDEMVDNQNKLNTTVTEYRLELDSFVKQFDDDLKLQVEKTVQEWHSSGFLDVIINTALNTQLDAFEKQLNNKLGGGNLVTMGDLSQEVKIALTGGSVAVVGENSVLTQNIVDKQVTPQKTNFVTSLSNIVDPSLVEPGIYYNFGSSVVQKGTSLDYEAIKIPIKPATWYSMNTASSTNFSGFTDGSNNNLGKVIDSVVKDTNLTIKSPVDATHLLISSQKPNQVSGVVVLETRRNITELKASDYPFGKPKEIQIPDLTVGTKSIEQVVDESKQYRTLYNSKDSLSSVNDRWIVFSSGTVSQQTGQATWTGKTAYSGMSSRLYLTSNAERVRMSVKGTFMGTGKVDMMLRYQTNANTTKYVSMAEATSSPFEMSFDFDPNNYAVYNDMTDFDVMVRNVQTVETNATITLSDFKTIELDVENLTIYDPDFKNVLKNIDIGINKVPETEQNETVFLTDYLGKKYLLNVDSTGNLGTTPIIPNKILIMGNSLVNGISDPTNPGGAFGMCASHYSKDFYNLVKQEILSHNSSATFTKAHTSDLEQGTTQANYEAYIAKETEKYTDDLDLIIMQLGDNVNTTEKETNFTKTFPQFMEHVRTKAPKARIIIVTGWYNRNYSVPFLQEIAKKYGAEFIQIDDLNTQVNQGYTGQVITLYDGSTLIAKDNWITHPGDKGFAEIAARIITKLNM